MVLRGAVVDLAGWAGAEVIVSVEIDILASAWNLEWLGDFLVARGISVVLMGYPLYLFDLWYTFKRPLKDLPPVALARRVYAKLRSTLVL
ncbi:MAG: hypothetical protein NT019_02815 [Candidatus Adlerbacteria bacterium]|nr:hypothetical protein [Candidatus Adlerbacteria bacterium]